MKKVTKEKSRMTLQRSEALADSCGFKRKEPRRSARIQNMTVTQGLKTKGNLKLQCAACNLVISEKVEEHGVVNCTKCANMFHFACSGIQVGWFGYLKFQCSKLEIECRKITKFEMGEKRGSKGTKSKMTDVSSDDQSNAPCRPDKKD